MRNHLRGDTALAKLRQNVQILNLWKTQLLKQRIFGFPIQNAISRKAAFSLAKQHKALTLVLGFNQLREIFEILMTPNRLEKILERFDIGIRGRSDDYVFHLHRLSRLIYYSLMRLKSILLFTAILTAPFSAFAAEPERELQSGLNYTTFGYDDKKEETTDKAADKGPEAPAAPQAPQKAAVAKPQKPTLTTQQNPEEEQSAEVRIWNKYKALASGQSQKPEEETTAKEDGKTKFEKAEAHPSARIRGR
jgi:hypothetical protein